MRLKKKTTPFLRKTAARFYAFSKFCKLFQAIFNIHSVLQEFPFLTVTKVPPGFVVHVGGVISSKSVKLLDEINNPGENTFIVLTYLFYLNSIFLFLISFKLMHSTPDGKGK